jgi:hypothetical protein
MKQFLTNVARSVARSLKAPSAPRPARRAHLAVESLEDRLVLSAALPLPPQAPQTGDAGGIKGVHHHQNSSTANTGNAGGGGGGGGTGGATRPRPLVFQTALGGSSPDFVDEAADGNGNTSSSPVHHVA